MISTGINAAASRHRWSILFGGWPVLALVIHMLLLTPLLKAEDSSRISTRLFEITPLVSYGSSANFPTQMASEAGPSIALDAGPGYGFIIGLHLHDDNVVEVRWLRQDSYTQIGNSNTNPPRVKTTLDQFHCGFTNEYRFKNRAPQVAPFITASIGATGITSESNPGSLHFSVGVGGGVKFFVGRHLGFRLQAEWSPVFVAPHAPAMCGSACGLNLGGGLVSRTEMAIGPVLRF